MFFRPLNMSIAFVTFFAVCFHTAVLPRSARACLGWSMEHTVLFEAVPATGIEDADVVAKVVIEQGSDWDNAGDAAWDGLEARIVSVEKGDLKKGDKIRMKIPLSSCGPWHKPGEEGLLIGKITGHDGDATLLQPYVRERGGNDGSVRLMN